MVKPVGGRGKAAPYKTVMVRTPEPIKSRVEKIKELYFLGELELWDKEIEENKYLADKYRKEVLSKKQDEKELTHFNKDDLIQLAKKILKQKKSAKLSIFKMLVILLGDDISLDDLI